MAKDTKEGRMTALFAKIVNKDTERGEYELELMGGNRITIDSREVGKIEEHICPATGIPIAKVMLDEESMVKTTIKARDLSAASQGLTVAPLPPFEYRPPVLPPWFGPPRPPVFPPWANSLRPSVSFDGSPTPMPFYGVGW